MPKQNLRYPASSKETGAANRQRSLKVPLFVLACLLVTLDIFRQSLRQGHLPTYHYPTATATARTPRLGDDCLLVFLDVGANIGIHSRFLFEPQHYPTAVQAHSVFDHVFGRQRDNRDICAFAFEPNPRHRSRHQQLQQAYEDRGWRYHVIEAGVSDDQGSNMTFYHKTNDRDKEEWAFSMVREKPEETPEVVPVIHLTEWIRHHIVERRLPSRICGQYNNQQQSTRGSVVMKLDIEGNEFVVLPNLFASGIFCRHLDVVFGEFHPGTAHLFNRPGSDVVNDNHQGQIQIGNGRDAMLWFRGLEKIMRSIHPKDCLGRWLNFDEESYLHDGVPLPVGNIKQEEPICAGA
ncbi:expressed unknown protein [Seminavis robusta]|uniref:Methyltransferase FkbM domain-containing protein n=1 Tax=Seminavis robusta TaxID=568900 RepID=A0A9N8H250_9STRA|nr:expressed unknown protein [Seminavis robusta]|eukprot:Sro57_g033100.1 n/a (349) ;mRNA; f:6166-7212